LILDENPHFAKGSAELFFVLKRAIALLPKLLPAASSPVLTDCRVFCFSQQFD
jgi:hypothetical protein